MNKQKHFMIRIDLESDKGISEGVPNLLKLFKKHNVKGNFYLVMGGESNIFEVLLLNRGKMTTAAERGIKIWSTKEKIRMLLFPRDFVRRNLPVLKQILEDGHELGLHGWKHREWTRNLEKVNLKKRFAQMLDKYSACFDEKLPKSWCSPGANVNSNVMHWLKTAGIKYTTDFDEMKEYDGIMNYPITLRGENNTPFIENLVSKGKTDEEILNLFIEKIKKQNYVSFYIHGMFEARFKIDLLEKMILELKKRNFKSIKVGDKI